MSKLETNIIAPSTGTTITIGESGDTVALGSGATQTGFGGVMTPAFTARRNGDQTFSNNTDTKVQFDTEVLYWLFAELDCTAPNTTYFPP